MKNIYILFTLFFLFITFSFAQQRNCGTDQNLEYRLKKDPELLKRMEDIEINTEIETLKRRDKDSLYSRIIIPVVVHVLYRNSIENISDVQIESQIDVLNEDFRRNNSDANNIWPQAIDTRIEFCLTTIDPNGNPTNGITRKQVTRKDWGLTNDMKKASQGGVNPWNTNRYLNIWIVPEMIGGFGFPVLGYAQYPGGAASTDGVVIGYNYFGRIGTLTAPYDKGRTATHEVGHFLNLRHIWGNGCSVDDFVLDTPSSDNANYGCDTGHVSCGTIDMVQNYMDYSDDACMNLFTEGQRDRMRAVLVPGGARASLAALDCDGCVGNLIIDQNVLNGVADNQEAEYTIVALNTIESGAQATYHASEEVLLTSNFDAINGSVFRAYLEGCSGDFESKGRGVSNEEINSTYLGLEENISKNNLKIYPNPANENATISIVIDETEAKVEAIAVLSMTGIAIPHKFTKVDGIHIEFRLSNKVKQGIYFVKITLEDGQVINKQLLVK
ncbi:M43 family zinc metalloprotease [uncultured Lacinutrix sp.]|uniref:M43 family zinc metalloprotease n=1 Tax=uncultured Lacinutrix sp. TaxID=574032 RepID=UPI002607C95A|nr:M43 family zinc metalloprotease [uncultured Lacinutrix sp.]